MIPVWCAGLTIAIVALPATTGHVRCSLYADEDGFLDTERAWRTVVVAPVEGRAWCDFGEVPAGRYAAAFHHDENDNGRMDFAFGALPLEPWGISRDAPLRPMRPHYEDAVFTHPGAPQTMTARSPR